MVRVLLVPNYSRPDALEDAHKIERQLFASDIDVLMAPNPNSLIESAPDLEDLNLVISFGGDGTLLYAARLIGYREIPILGLSYGHLGFLTAAGPERLAEIVARALAGDMHISRRSTLHIETHALTPDSEEKILHNFALNDFCIGHGSMGDMVVFDIAVSGHHIDRLRGDGVVVATATGSTGYALSAGGPIVSPSFRGMICVPVAPHTILARAFLTSPSDTVELTISQTRARECFFFADGIRIGKGLRPLSATVSQGEGDVLLLDLSQDSFYQAVSRVFYGRDSHDR